LPGMFPVRTKGNLPVTIASADAKTLRPGIAEQLAITLTDGSKARLTAFWPRRQSRPIALLDKGASLTEKALSDPAYNPPTFETPFGWRMRLSVWHAKSRVPNKRDLNWLLPMIEYPSQPLRFDLSHEQPLDHAPDSIQITPGGYLLLFDFDAAMARLTVCDAGGKFTRGIDLVKLGGFHSGAEAKASLNWRSPLAPGPAGWTPLSQYPDQRKYGREQIELWDSHQNRYVLTLDRNPNAVEAEVFRGLAARRPKELIDPHAYKLLNERSASSPDGKFCLRYRTFAGKGIPNFARMTLLARVPEGKSTAEIELWSNSIYFDVPFFTVTNSGRSLFYETGHMPVLGTNGAPDHVHDYVSLRVVRIDGTQCAESSAIESWGFKSLADALARIEFGKTKVESLGKPEVVQRQGLSVHVYPAEKITVPIKDGDQKVFYILAHAANTDDYFTSGAQTWERDMIRAALGSQK
jgi:hypothetical protein